MVERKRNETGPLNAEQHRQLRQLVRDIEATEDEIDLQKKYLSGIYEEAAGYGFDVPSLKDFIKERKQTSEQFELFEQRRETVATYRAVVAQPDKPPRSMMIDRPFAPPLDA